MSEYAEAVAQQYGAHSDIEPEVASNVDTGEDDEELIGQENESATLAASDDE